MSPLVDDGDDYREPLPDTRTPVPPAPCQSPEPCPLASSCAARRWACKAFAEYVERGRWSTPPGKPTPEIYARIFSGDDSTPAPDEAAPPPVKRPYTRRKVRLNLARGRPSLAEQLAARKAERLAERATRAKVAP